MLSKILNYQPLFIGLVCGAGLLGSSGCSSGSDDNDAPNPTPAYVFEDAEPAAYTRVDRMGMPAVATAVISSKNLYNQADPSDDADGDFVAEITANVAALHSALDDDLTAAGLTPATTDESIAQAAPLIVPDTLSLDTSMAAGFPNGRKLADPVIDVTLAVVLLDLSVHMADVLAELPLNPPTNDKAFLTVFPYLAAPHVPASTL